MDREIKRTVNRQREFFSTGTTKEYGFRRRALYRLSEALEEYEEELLQALRQDLNKSSFESYMSEIGLVKTELRFLKRRLWGYMKGKRALPALSQLPGNCRILPEPYGVVLIMAPWNYPVLLCLEPLIDALSAGNCVILKPSAYTPAVSSVLKKMLGSVYPRRYVAVVEGGREENESLLAQRFDYIFFTGGVTVGRLVLTKAARYLTPVTLELGGKSPCIVDDTADIALAARRIVFGKLLNAGQTCVAPDYVAVQERVADRLIIALKREIEAMLGKEPLKNPDYPKIINRKHYERVLSLIKGEALACGGTGDPRTLKIAPAILIDPQRDAPVMREEIFGPVLPVLRYRTKEDLRSLVESYEKPLALYLFSEDRRMVRWVTDAFSFGGGCVNDTVIHLASSRMPFGGVGGSGMGAYHGKTGFDTFSHYKSVVSQRKRPEIPLRYHPYTGTKEKLLRVLFR